MNNSTSLAEVNDTALTGLYNRQVIFTPTIFTIYNVYLSLSLILGVTGNGLVLMVFAKYKASTSTDWFIIFITIFDFISSVFNVPVYLTFTTGLWKEYGNDIFCKVHYFISQSVALSSTFLVSGLAIERYLKICLKNGFKISKSRALYICIVITVATTLLSVPCFQMYRNTRGQCGTSSLEDEVFIYYMMVLCTYIIAFIIVTFSYTSISAVVLKSERNISRHSNGGHKESYSWCCVKSKNNRILPAPSSFVTHTSSSMSDDDKNAEQDGRGQNGKSNSKIGVLATNAPTSNQLQVPSMSKSITKTTLVSVSTLSSNSKVNADHQSVSSNGGQTPGKQVPAATSRRRQGKRTTRITFAVCLIFILSWLPPWIAFLLYSQPHLRIKPAVLIFGLFGRMTYLFNTFMNPILYLSLNRKFREQTSHFICFWK